MELTDLIAPLTLGIYRAKEGARYRIRVALWQTSQLELILREVKFL